MVEQGLQHAYKRKLSRLHCLFNAQPYKLYTELHNWKQTAAYILVLNRQSAVRTFSIVKNNCSARTCYHSSAEARHKDFYKVQSWWVAEHRSLPLLRTVVAQESLGQSTCTALQLAIRYLANNLAFCVQPMQRSFVGKLFAVPKDDFQRRPRHFFTSCSVCIAFSKSLFFFIATVNSFGRWMLAVLGPTPPRRLVVRMRARVPAGQLEEDMSPLVIAEFERDIMSLASGWSKL